MLAQSFLADGDVQLWTSYNIVAKLAKVKIKLEEEFRFGDDISAIYYHHVDSGLSYSKGWWFLGANYRHIYERKKKRIWNEWKQEARPHFNFGAKWRWLKLRNRIEARFRDELDWRYRMKLNIPLPVKKITPYLADEIFITSEGFTSNRIYFGVKFDFDFGISSDLFFLWQAKKASRWIDYYVAGVKLKLGG